MVVLSCGANEIRLENQATTMNLRRFVLKIYFPSSRVRKFNDSCTTYTNQLSENFFPLTRRYWLSNAFGSTVALDVAQAVSTCRASTSQMHWSELYWHGSEVVWNVSERRTMLSRQDVLWTGHLEFVDGQWWKLPLNNILHILEHLRFDATKTRLVYYKYAELFQVQRCAHLGSRGAAAGTDSCQVCVMLLNGGPVGGHLTFHLRCNGSTSPRGTAKQQRINLRFSKRKARWAILMGRPRKDKFQQLRHSELYKMKPLSLSKMMQLSRKWILPGCWTLRKNKSQKWPKSPWPSSSHARQVRDSSSQGGLFDKHLNTLRAFKAGNHKARALFSRLPRREIDIRPFVEEVGCCDELRFKLVSEKCPHEISRLNPPCPSKN